MTSPRLRTLAPIPPTIGIDPGSGLTATSGTGIAAVVGVELVRATTLVRAPHDDLATSLRRYFLRVMEVVDGWTRQLRSGASWTIAVEFCADPAGHVDGRRTRAAPAAPVLSTWLGGMLCAHYRAIAVYPDRHGRRCPTGGDLADYYPRRLCGRRPAGWSGESRSRDHERAAYDVAFAAHRQHDRFARGA